MKMHHLPDIDLANIATLADSYMRRRALEKFKISRPPHTYHPVRRFSPDIMNISIGPLVDVDATRPTWKVIADAIASEAAAGSEANANLAVGKALYAFSEQHGLFGRKQDGFLPLPIGVSASVNFWLKAVIQCDGRAMVPFIDPRRSKKLTAEGRRFAFSVMHERIRVAFPDLSDVDLGIIQFLTKADDSREAKLFVAHDVPLFSFAELDAMVRDTYSIWADVLSERVAETRRRGSGGTGSLL